MGLIALMQIVNEMKAAEQMQQEAQQAQTETQA